MTLSDVLVALAVSLSLGGAAIAQPPGASERIDAIFGAAEATPDLAFSFTMTFEVPGAPPLVQRFDAATGAWQPIEGDPDTLPDAARQKLRNVMKSETKPGGLLYADFRQHLDDITFDRAEDGQWVYAFVPPEARGRDVGEELDEVMLARLYVDPDTDILARYEVRARKPFKPMPVAKLDEFVVVQEFARLGGTGPAVLTRMYSRTKGRRAFRPIDTEFTATFTDVVAVD